MKKVTLFLSVMLAVVLLASCGKGKKSVFTPTSSGLPYEMLVVVDDSLWQRAAGRALFDVLDTDVPGLPQSERSFRISNVSPNHFDSVLKIFRNIIVVDIRDIYTQPKLKFARDLHAVPQMIMTIQAPDEESFEAFVIEKTQTIIDFFVTAEMNRQITVLKDKHNGAISQAAEELFGCDIWLPSEILHYKRGEHFFWPSTNAPTADMNFVMYSYPYTSEQTFTKKYFIAKRDSVMKANIPGAQPGMYMATDSLSVEVRNIGVKGVYAQEARGLWHVKGDMMGGPFVSHSSVDKVNKRVVVTEVFIYSPDKLKRNLMRKLEASLFTLTLPEMKQSAAEIEVDKEVVTE